MALFNSIFSSQIRVLRVGHGQVKHHEGLLGLVSSLEYLLKAEHLALTHLYSHTSLTSTYHSTPSSSVTLRLCICISCSVSLANHLIKFNKAFGFSILLLLNLYILVTVISSLPEG